MSLAYTGSGLAGSSLDSQLDQLQNALMGFITTAQQTSKDSRKREILIALGGTVTKREAVKTKGGEWKFTQVNDTVKSTEKIMEHRLLPNGLIEAVEKEVLVYAPKMRTTSEYIQIPRDCDISELAAEQGAPLSERLVHALKIHTSSEVLKSATEIFWGAPVENTPVPIQILGREGDEANILALTPILGLCEETGVEYEWLDADALKDDDPVKQLHTKARPPRGAPAILHLPRRPDAAATAEDRAALVAAGAHLFGAGAILRYLAGRYHLEAWYPSELGERALCDLALDFHATAFAPLVAKAAAAAPGDWKDDSDDAKKWRDDLRPALEHLVRRAGGVTLGGERPNLADLFFLTTITDLSARRPDHAILTDLAPFHRALLRHLPASEKYLPAVKRAAAKQ